MDEEQGLSSPIAGGLRGIRRSVSSSIFTGRAVPPPVQPDPQTTNLLNQNSLTLTTVSQQLRNISVGISSLNFSLNSIKDNLGISDSLARQREAAKQNRERILAEQGLREGKESDIEKRIQFALLTPVRRIAAKTQGILSRLTNFFFILAGGWLTNTIIDMINANADGNVELLNKLKGKLTTGLIVIGATFTALTVGLKKVFGLTALLASRAFRFGFNNILRRPFSAIINLLTGQVGKVLGRVGMKGVSLGIGGGTALGLGGAIASLPLIGPVYSFFEKQFKKLAEAFGKKPSASVPVPGAAKSGLLQKAFGPFRKIFGGVKSTFAVSTLFDIFVGGENPLEAIKNNLGGIIVAAIAAPLVIFAAGKIAAFLGLGAIAAGIIKLILSAIPFGIGKNLFSKIKIPGFGGKKEEKTETEVSAVEAESSTLAFGMNTESSTVDNSMIASNANQSDSITPVNSKKELNVAENISNVEEGQPSVVNIPIVGGDSGGGGAAPSGQVEEPSSKIPFIAFDNNNIHTSFAVSTFGAFA
tara:strand:+ start:1943 stop:3532 length:1590 start_codon:yes stop_codon:yes gene_type:complete